MQNYATWIQVVLVFIFIKTEDFYEVIVDDVEKGFDTSNYEVNRPLSTGKNKKVLKDELGGGGEITIELVALRRKPYSHLMDDCNSDKNLKEQKMFNKMNT